jgi:tetratricopeptide (TPR) repeat protein
VEYAFRHVLTQETVYQNILRRRRAGLHQQVAEAMEVLYWDDLSGYYEQLAYHNEQAEAWAKALEYLIRAGDKARLAHAHQDARAFFVRALAVCERLGDAALPIAFEVAQKCADVTAWPTKQAETARLFTIARRLGELNGEGNPLDKGAIEQLFAISRRPGRRRYEGLAPAYLGNAEATRQEFEAAEEALRAALAIGEEEGYDDVRQRAHRGLGLVCVRLGRPAAAQTHLRAARALIPEKDGPVVRSSSYLEMADARCQRGQALLTDGNLEAAEQEITTALRVAQEIGNLPQLWKTLAAMGDLRAAQGNSDAAREAYREALAVIDRVAAGLTDAALRRTFLASPHVRRIRQKAE